MPRLTSRHWMNQMMTMTLTIMMIWCIIALLYSNTKLWTSETRVILDLQRRGLWEWQWRPCHVRRAASVGYIDAPGPRAPCRRGRRTPVNGTGEVRDRGGRTPSTSRQTCRRPPRPQVELPWTTECRRPPASTAQTSGTRGKQLNSKFSVIIHPILVLSHLSLFHKRVVQLKWGQRM